MTAIRAAFKAYRMHQVLIMPRFARLTIALGLATAVFPVDAEYYFNPRFLSNDLAESVDLSAFTKGREAPPGTYRVDIYLNDEFMTSRDITFIADDNNAELIPCLSTDLLVSLGIKKSALLDNKEHSAEKHVPDNSACTPLQDRLADASTEFDVGQQHLSLSVPQIYVGRMARGYVSPDLWEEGINAGLLNYSFNGNSINNRSNHNAGKSNYAYLNLQSGINIGSWRLRDNSGSGNPRNFTWNIISNNNVVMPTGGCTVDSRNVTVDLPDFPGSAEIPLGVYCSSEQKLSFYLSGATTDSARQVFANTAPDATKASGVGVSLMRNGKILATGENVSLGTVNKSKVPLGLSATYGQTGNKVSAGTVQSVIGVTFIYE